MGRARWWGRREVVVWPLLGAAPGVAVLSGQFGATSVRTIMVGAVCLALGFVVAARAIVRSRATGRVGSAWRFWLAVNGALAALSLVSVFLLSGVNVICDDSPNCAQWEAEKEAEYEQLGLRRGIAGLALVGLLTAATAGRHRIASDAATSPGEIVQRDAT